MRKVVLYIAASLDGFIAEPEESLDWLTNVKGQGDNGYEKFYETVDTILMGGRTYRWVMEHGEFPYAGKECYVFSRQNQPDTEFVQFCRGSCTELVRELQGREGKNIWLEGGRELVRQFLNERLVDEIILTIAPVILGKGIPLFSGLEQETNLRLTEMKRYGQFAQLRYACK